MNSESTVLPEFVIALNIVYWKPSKSSLSKALFNSMNLQRNTWSYKSCYAKWIQRKTELEREICRTEIDVEKWDKISFPKKVSSRVVKSVLYSRNLCNINFQCSLSLMSEFHKKFLSAQLFPFRIQKRICLCFHLFTTISRQKKYLSGKLSESLDT